MTLSSQREATARSAGGGPWGFVDGLAGVSRSTASSAARRHRRQLRPMASDDSMADDDELIVCQACHSTYDRLERLPKFLDCHHCYCLACIKVKRRRSCTVTVAFDRDALSSTRRDASPAAAEPPQAVAGPDTNRRRCNSPHTHSHTHTPTLTFS